MLQGFWPDGVYTAPTDEALASDIKFTKSLGMNLLRKHIKVTSTSTTGRSVALQYMLYTCWLSEKIPSC